MQKSLLALASGTLGLGISEFVMMGLLPHVAAYMGISEPQAGYFISAYALGVCVGAPLTTLIAFRQPLKRVLVALFVVYLVGNLMAGLSSGYASMLVARFVSGLPHGAFFGVGSIVAERASRPGRETESMSVMIAGMTIANVIGVPLGTWLAGVASWRAIFFLASCWGLLTLLALWQWVPHQEALPDTGVKGQFRFVGHVSAIYIILATMFSNGAIFCWYSYIMPQMREMGGFGPEWQTALMVLAGIGMVCGNLLGGRLAARRDPAWVDMVLQGVAVAMLLLMAAFEHIGWLSVVLMVCLTGLLFSFSPAQQSLILKQAYGGKMMAAAFIQIAFNLGNAVGAYVGGLPIEAGMGYRVPPLIGAAIMCFGVLSLWLYVHHNRGKAVEQD